MMNTPERRHILIVDDHAMLRDAVTTALKASDRGYAVYEATSGPEALKWIDAYGCPDLVLLDINMPGANGFSVLACLKKDHPRLKVAILSGNDDPATIRQAMNAGVVGFVTKAVSSDALVAKVAELLDGVQSVTTTSGRWDTAPTDTKGLTNMQARAVELCLQGLSNRDIGKALGCAEGTVKTHLYAAFKVYGVTSRGQLIAEINKRKSQQ